MKKIILILILSLPIFAQQAAYIIDERIKDIYFANGMLVTRDDAQKALDKIIKPAVLKDIFKEDEEAMLREVRFQLAYNNSYGVFFDVLEAISQKKAEHKYFWQIVSAIFEVSGRIQKHITKGMTEEVAKLYAKEVLTEAFIKQIRNTMIDALQDEGDMAGITNVIDAIESDMAKGYWTKAIDAVVELLENMDISVQVNHMIDSVISGHQIIVIAHSQGNFFMNKAYDKIKEKHSWMEQYIKILSVATPANKAKDGVVTFHNDPIILIPDRAGENMYNPIRYMEWFQSLCYFTNDSLVCEMPKDDCVEHFYMNGYNVPGVCYAKDGTEYDDRNMDDVHGAFHYFEYYMSEELPTKEVSAPFYLDTYTPVANPAREAIIKFIAESMEAFRKTPSQWAIIFTDYNEHQKCEDRLLKVTHGYDSSIDAYANISKVYPFAYRHIYYTDGPKPKIYFTNGAYVYHGDFEGISVEARKNADKNWETCYILKNQNGEDIEFIDGFVSSRCLWGNFFGHIRIGNIESINGDIISPKDDDLKFLRNVRGEFRIDGYPNFYNPEIEYGTLVCNHAWISSCFAIDRIPNGIFSVHLTFTEYNLTEQQKQNFQIPVSLRVYYYYMGNLTFDELHMNVTINGVNALGGHIADIIYESISSARIKNLYDK